jgi:hypothetical protein
LAGREVVWRDVKRATVTVPLGPLQAEPERALLLVPWPAGDSVVNSVHVKYEHDIASAESRSATDAAPGLFAPDLLLATQHAVARLPESPCRRLVAAVLERALLDAVGPTFKQPDRDDALAWFRSEDDDPFSFRWVAFQLGMDPDWLRSRLRRVQQGARPVAPEVTAPPSEPASDGDGGNQRAA